MGDALEVKPLLQPRRVAELAPEAQQFKACKVAFKYQEKGRVADLAYCPVSPHRLAVVSGTKVGLWQGVSRKDGELQEANQISKFKDLTTCVSWRSDGRLLLAGEAGGSCAVIEADSKNVLRRLRGHGDAVTCACFATADKSRAATGSKDGKLRIWDVATSDLVCTLNAHSDSLKVLAAGPSGPDSWITAGYDGRVKLWDIRTPDKQSSAGKAASPVSSADHGQPVEAGCAFPGGGLFATAGGTVVKVWDLAIVSRPVLDLSEGHSKAVMGICLDSKASVLLTASFDGLAKVYHAADLTHIWTYRLPAPATCIAWRPDDRGFAVGLDDGNWQYHCNKAANNATQKKVVLAGEVVKVQKKWKNREGHLRGSEHQPESDDEVVDQRAKKRKKEPQLDYFFRKFEHKKAIEWVLMRNADASLGLSVVEELLERGALATAFSDLGEDLCLQAIKWFVKVFAVGDALQRSLFDEALHSLLEGNRCLKPPCTNQLVDALHQLETKINQEMRVQEALVETNAMIETLVASIS